MILRLDPRYPLVWRTPDTIQLGIDRPLAIVPGVTAPLEGVIAALRGGVPRSGALMLGRQAGATDEATSALLSALGPALVGGTADVMTGANDTAADSGAVADGSTGTGAPAGASPPGTAHPGPDDAARSDARPRTASGGTTADRALAGHRPVVCVDGAGATADRIRSLLGELSITVVTTEVLAATGAASPPPLPDLAVIVDHFVLAPERHVRWLRRDIPHLPVLFSDAEVRVGPLVEPGAGPCLTCLELDRVDEDPAWPAIACQLLYRTASTETPRLGIEAAATVAGIVHERLFAASNEFTAASLAIDAISLSVRRRAHRPHVRCGCRFLPENVIVLAGNAAGFRPRTN
ncbi:TOMM precursor leader peptide-binding protein [Cryobacterium arcticum]|uniref:TOMM precursor leader peptide-binding protein n=1 Tax=Cryobacterium arcticum TaxID=670052 RepID=UPI0012EE4C8A|nr:TOMM precursor leader peptide-binding protein [Cryobacterium arcticum]